MSAPENLTIALEPADQPEALWLLAQSDAAMQALYPAESNHPVDVATLMQADARFLIARHAGAACGCGALLLEADLTAEIKRMYVVETARGRGVAQAILDRLEQLAAEAGIAVLRLETGIHSHAALALYRRNGYRERPPFGSYRPDPLSVFMEKRLA